MTSDRLRPERYFEFDQKLGLVLSRTGGQTRYIAWRHVCGVYNWVVNQGKSFRDYPGQVFTRAEVAFILAHPEECVIHRLTGEGAEVPSSGFLGGFND